MWCGWSPAGLAGQQTRFEIASILGDNKLTAHDLRDSTTGRACHEQVRHESVRGQGRLIYAGSEERIPKARLRNGAGV